MFNIQPTDEGPQWVEVEINPEPQMFYVVAGDYRQARYWAKSHGVAPVYWKFVNTPQDLQGARGACGVLGKFLCERKSPGDQDRDTGGNTDRTLEGVRQR